MEKTYEDVLNDNNESELLLAFINNDIDTAKKLIDLGANVNITSKNGLSPYFYLATSDNLELLTYVLKEATIDYSLFDEYGNSALIKSVTSGKLDNVKLLLQLSKEDIDHQNNNGYTALIEVMAETDGSLIYQQIVSELMAHGANSGLQDKKMKTALDYAKEKDMVAMIEVLLSSRSGYVNF